MAGELIISVASGTPRQLWCDDCLTSARYEVDLFVLGKDGLILLATAHGCDHCKTGASAPSNQDQGEA